MMRCIMLTMVAVMKKFHGSRVPKPNMKKINQTPLYLSREEMRDEIKKLFKKNRTVHKCPSFIVTFMWAI